MIERFFTPGHTIERYITGVDQWGDPVENWAAHLTLPGKLWALDGDERLSADKVTHFADYKFACGLNDITELDRYIAPDGRVFNIKAVARRTRPDGTGHLELALELVR